MDANLSLLLILIILVLLWVTFLYFLNLFKNIKQKNDEEILKRLDTVVQIQKEQVEIINLNHKNLELSLINKFEEILNLGKSSNLLKENISIQIIETKNELVAKSNVIISILNETSAEASKRDQNIINAVDLTRIEIEKINKDLSNSISENTKSINNTLKESIQI